MVVIIVTALLSHHLLTRHGPFLLNTLSPCFSLATFTESGRPLRFSPEGPTNEHLMAKKFHSLFLNCCKNCPCTNSSLCQVDPIPEAYETQVWLFLYILDPKDH